MHYRIYYLDADNHHIGVLDFRAPGDLAAIVRAGPPIFGELRELWNQGRKVLEFRG